MLYKRAAYLSTCMTLDYWIRTKPPPPPPLSKRKSMMTVVSLGFHMGKASLWQYCFKTCCYHDNISLFSIITLLTIRDTFYTAKRENSAVFFSTCTVIKHYIYIYIYVCVCVCVYVYILCVCILCIIICHTYII